MKMSYSWNFLKYRESSITVFLDFLHRPELFGIIEAGQYPEPLQLIIIQHRKSRLEFINISSAVFIMMLTAHLWLVYKPLAWQQHTL
jgi:hypothetical protein